MSERPDDEVMTLEISDLFNWEEASLWMYFKETPWTHCFIVWHDGKVKINESRYQEENCRAAPVWLTFGIKFPDARRCYIYLIKLGVQRLEFYGQLPIFKKPDIAILADKHLFIFLSEKSLSWQQWGDWLLLTTRADNTWWEGMPVSALSLESKWSVADFFLKCFIFLNLLDESGFSWLLVGCWLASQFFDTPLIQTVMWK